MTIVRAAVPDDFRRYSGFPLPDDWCAGDWVCGYAMEQDGAVVAYGLLTQDAHGRIWAWFSRKVAVSRFLMHRGALDLLAAARNAGEPALYAICSEGIPGAAMWLERLGFRPGDMAEAGRVWQCDLSS